jgi:hypothetical protein
MRKNANIKENEDEVKAKSILLCLGQKKIPRIAKREREVKFKKKKTTIFLLLSLLSYYTVDPYSNLSHSVAVSPSATTHRSNFKRKRDVPPTQIKVQDIPLNKINYH